MRCRVYDLSAINAMVGAIEQALEELSDGSQREPEMKRKVALSIIRFFDEGESNPDQLSRMAVATNAFSDRWRAHREDLCSTIKLPAGFEKWPVAF